MADNLFCQKLPVLIKYSDLEERKCSIQVSVDVQIATSPHHRKELVIRLTDENDLFFLYTLKLNEEDFQSLKSQQGLLVDFSSFPQSVIDLLELCLKEEANTVPKFVLHLVTTSKLGVNSGPSHLNVVETNPFKHLTHLSLKLLPGSDTDIKKYLATCLSQLKEYTTKLERSAENKESDLTQRLAQTQQALSARTRELDSLKVEWESRTSELSSRLSKDINTERERAVQIQSSSHQKYEREKRELEQAHMQIVKQLETRAYDLESKNKDLMDRKYQAESSIRDLKSKLSSIEEEHVRAKQELQSLRKHNSSLDGDRYEQEKVLNQARTRIAVLEQEVKDKDQVMSRSNDLLSLEQDQKKKCEEELEKKSRHVSKLEQSVKVMSDEMVKANEIIKKLQGEIRNYHGKLKLRNQVTTEQENILGEKSKEIDNLKKDLETTQRNLKQKEEETTKLNESLENTMKKLEESKQLLKTNENVINWLNKQVTEQQMSHTRTGTFEMHSANNSAATFRPTSTGLHNFSSGSYSTGVTQASLGNAGNNLQVPPSRQPQVQFQPGLSRPSAVTLSRTSPIPPIPEEISPKTSPTPHRNKENDPPLDPKYLQKSSSNKTVPVSLATGSTRLSKQGIIPNTRPALVAKQPTLASAYFPSQART
ncbi:unnamed protein product [Owenia fusiformis]|uniref:Spindle assembly abnormal protein 6 homolog n=1 Tax=Owenia fusiformis TaxID=6347 RepID=A0A8S4N527_OWEFU|nr:unnamed protein product [Owenia fusiformis]